MSTKDFSSIQENRVANYLGFSVVSGSGARDCHPGDIIGKDWLGECKTHVSKVSRISFKLDVWKKICDEATAKHRYPVLIVDEGSQELANTWVMVKISSLPKDFWKIEVNSRIVQISKNTISFINRDAKKVYDRCGFCLNASKVVMMMIAYDEDVGLMPLSVFKEVVS
nr:MAG TPA: hypothetical protein [Caudoviricetes sp.]